MTLQCHYCQQILYIAVLVLQYWSVFCCITCGMGCASKKECIMQEVLFSNTFLKNVRKINTFYIVVAINRQTWCNLFLEISEYGCWFSVIITTSGWPGLGHGVSYLASLLDLCTSCGYSKFTVYYAVIDIISSIKDVWFSSQHSAVKKRM